MLSTVLYYELAMKVPNPVGITVYLLTWGLGHLRCLVLHKPLLSVLQLPSKTLARGQVVPNESRTITELDTGQLDTRQLVTGQIDNYRHP